MTYIMRWLIIAMAFTICQGQLSSVLFPGFMNTARNIIGTIAGQPLFNTVAKSAGDLVADAVFEITRVPVAVARAVGVSDNTPAVINDNNIRGISDAILADYRAGLKNRDAALSVGDLIRKYGYPLEKHETVTDDGYILSMYRIPSKGPVVFLMHGLLGSADDFVIAGPENSLAYLLSKEGYDVWMGNARGNKHSRRHVEMEPSNARFWDFSWHEIGCWDLPAMIDYVLNTTDTKSLKYIGHSQGTTSFFVMGSQRPEYNKKISLMIALSPVAFMSNSRSPLIRLLSPNAGLLYPIFKTFGLYEFLPDSTFLRVLRKLMCDASPLSEVMCSNTAMLICGFGFAELNATNLPVIFGHVPSGASVKQLTHYSQGYLSGDFKQYDYGSQNNLEKYGREVPPSYPLEKLTAPVSLFYSDADWLSHPDDVDKLYQRLGNAIDIHKIPHSQFNHLDFLWAKHFKTLIYERLRKLLKAT